METCYHTTYILARPVPRVLESHPDACFLSRLSHVSRSVPHAPAHWCCLDVFLLNVIAFTSVKVPGECVCMGPWMSEEVRPCHVMPCMVICI